MNLRAKERTVESFGQLEGRLPNAGDSAKGRYWTFIVQTETGDQQELGVIGTLERSADSPDENNTGSEIVFKSSSYTPPIEFVVTPETIVGGALKVISRRPL